ncbi:unnamed protein product [Orchesella dallaii]|uniref:RING-type E3 ubiquitin transferase n=1 Tax=Orchesella dallaii TaxID=48710 RepID=A0ABP1RLD5_9HEXA
MENLRECPICLEIPEKDIYQCSQAHIICNLCITKLTECPQCRTNYGAKRIRCRVLEALLNDQMFECKFNEKGCRDVCRRSDISNHTNSCQFNPDRVPLCEMLGFRDCKFGLNIGSHSKFRSEIISHFINIHKKPYHQRGSHAISIEKFIRTFFLNLPGQTKHKGFFCSLTREETSPLFYVAFEINNTNEFLSLNSFHVWGKEEKKYEVEYSFVRTSISSSTSISTDPLIIRWTSNVCTLREVRNNRVKRCPIHLHIPWLTDINIGDNANDTFTITISQIT